MSSAERENYAEPKAPVNGRRVRRTAAIIVLVCVAILLIEMATVPHRYTQEEADRITVGMTADEVEALMGRPPDERSLDSAFSVWKSNATSIEVEYQVGRVAAVVRKSASAPGIYTRWRRHLGLSD